MWWTRFTSGKAVIAFSVPHETFEEGIGCAIVPMDRTARAIEGLKGVNHFSVWFDYFLELRGLVAEGITSKVARAFRRVSSDHRIREFRRSRVFRIERLYAFQLTDTAPPGPPLWVRRS